MSLYQVCRTRLAPGHNPTTWIQPLVKPSTTFTLYAWENISHSINTNLYRCLKTLALSMEACYCFKCILIFVSGITVGISIIRRSITHQSSRYINHSGNWFQCVYFTCAWRGEVVHILRFPLDSSSSSLHSKANTVKLAKYEARVLGACSRLIPSLLGGSDLLSIAHLNKQV